MTLIPSSPWSHEVLLFDEYGVDLPCVGTIISSYLILTVASCLYRNRNGRGRNKLTIETMGGNGQNTNLQWDEVQIRRIFQTIFHPRFQNSSSENDLAILVLDEHLNSSVNILPIMNATLGELTSLDFSGRCQQSSALHPLKIMKPSQCGVSSVKSDRLCLFIRGSKERSSKCSRSFPGSSLICSDAKRGQFLCGISAFSPANLGGRGQIYTNITHHLKWIESVSAETQTKANAKARVKVKESDNLNEMEREEASFELSADDFRDDVVANSSSFKALTRKTRSVAYNLDCGGFVNLDREKEIIYLVPEEVRDKFVCVWIVAAPRSSSIETEVLSNPKAKFQTPETTLFAIYNYKLHADGHSKILSQGKKWTIRHPFFVLYFRTTSAAPNSNQTSGFHIRLKGARKRGAQKAVKYLEVPPPSTDDATSELRQFKYPEPPATRYANDERTFIIVKPTARHGKLKLEMKYLQTESNCDWIEVSTVVNGTVLKSRFHGRGLLSDAVFEAAEEEPFILYFHSDHSDTGVGFQFTYSEQRRSQVESRGINYERNFNGMSKIEFLEKYMTPEEMVKEFGPDFLDDMRDYDVTVDFAPVCPNGCPELPDLPDEDVKFLLYTSENPTLNQELDAVTNASWTNVEAIKGAHTIIICHGFMSDTKSGPGEKLRDEYFEHYRGRLPVNIILVDWSAAAKLWKNYGPYLKRIYFPPAIFVYAVGFNTKLLIRKLMDQVDVPLDEFHLIGHSLGGQAMGYAGKILKDDPDLTPEQQVGRLTALDPAGPCFEKRAWSSLFCIHRPDGYHSVSKEDAKFVDVIHSNTAVFGMTDPVGHIDFYPNGGANQPGCWYMPVCSHSRSIDLMAASINGDKMNYKAAICDTNDAPRRACEPTTEAEFNYLGQHVNKSVTSHGVYYLRTLGKPPYSSQY